MCLLLTSRNRPKNNEIQASGGREPTDSYLANCKRIPIQKADNLKLRSSFASFVFVLYEPEA